MSHYSNIKHMACLCAALAGPAFGLAQETTDSVRTHQLQPVVVTAQFAPQSPEASVYHVKVMDADEIRAKGATNLRELLGTELLIDLHQSSVFGSDIEMQGVSKENVKILVDGTPVTGRLNGIIDLNHMPLDDVERVEIIEGPTSVYYGTDALAGVVNIITKKYQEKTFESSLTGYYESVGQYDVSAKAGIRGKKDMLQVSGGRNYFDGFSADDTTRNQQWESREQYFGKLNYQYYFGDLKASNSFKYFIEELIKLGDPDPDNQAKDVYYTTRRWNNDLGFKGPVWGNKYVDLAFSYSDYKRWNNAYNVNLDDGQSQLSEKSSDHDTTLFGQWFFKGQFSKNDDSRINYTLGYDFTLESTEGSRILDGEQSIGDYGFFGSASFAPVRSLVIQPGVRYSHNTIYSAPVSPALNMKWQTSSSGTLRASYARGYRAPSLKELYLDFKMQIGPFTYHIQGNDSLEAEQSHNYNLSYAHVFGLGPEKSLSVEPSLFYNDIENLIVLSDLVNFERYYINVNTHKTYGARLEIAFKPGKNLRVAAGAAHVARYNAFTEDFNVAEYTHTYDLNGEVGYCLPDRKTAFAVYYRYKGERPGFVVDRGSGEISETLIEGYNIMDASVTRSIAGDFIKVTAGAKNLLDIRNIDTVGKQSGETHSTDLALWGRSFFVKLRFLFRSGS